MTGMQRMGLRRCKEFRSCCNDRSTAVFPSERPKNLVSCWTTLPIYGTLQNGGLWKKWKSCTSAPTQKLTTKK